MLENEKEELLEKRYLYSKDLKLINSLTTSYLSLCIGNYGGVSPDYIHSLDFNSEYNDVLRNYLVREIEKIDIKLGI